MSRFSRHMVLICALILCLVPSSITRLATGPVPASAAGTPSAPWPQFRQDPTHQARSQAVGPQIPTLPLWRYAASGIVFSSPAVGPDGTVYVGSGGSSFYAINPNGTTKWTFTAPAALDTDPVVGSLTIGSSVETVVYISSAAGVIYALTDTGTPTLLWSNGFDPNLTGVMTLSGGHLFAGTSNGNMYEFDATTGTLLHSFGVGSTIADAPAIGPDGSVYFAAYNHTVYALSPSFTLEWSYTTGQAINSSPAIGADGTVYIGSTDDYLYALSAPSSGTAGVLDWRYHTNGSIESSPAIGTDGTIYVGSDDGNVYAISHTGGLVWAHYTGALVYSSPALDGAGDVYVGNFTGTLSALNGVNGTVLWTYTNPTGSSFESSPAIGTDGTLYIGGYDDYLYAFSSNPPPTATPTSTVTVTFTPAATATSTPTSTSTAAPTPVYVQGNSADPQVSQSTVTVNYTRPQVAGDINVVVVGWNDNTATISAVVDSAGNSYQVAVPMGQTTGLRQAIYYAKNIGTSATNSVTVSFSQAAAYPDIRIMEYGNVDKTTPFDGGSTSSGTAATATSGGATTTSPDLLVGAGMTLGLFAGAGSGYTNRMITTPDGDIAEDQVAPAIGSHTATAPVNDAWLMQLAAFKVVGGSTPTATPSRTVTATPTLPTTPTLTPSPSATNTPSRTMSPTSSPTGTSTPSVVPPSPTTTATSTLVPPSPTATATSTLVPPSATATSTSTVAPLPSPTATSTIVGCTPPPTVGSGLALTPTSGTLTDLFTVTIDPSVGVGWQGWFLKWDRQTILVAGQGLPVSNLEFVPPASANAPGYHTVDLYQATLNGSTLVLGPLAASVPYRVSGGVCDPPVSPTVVSASPTTTAVATGTPTMDVSQTL